MGEGPLQAQKRASSRSAHTEASNPEPCLSPNPEPPQPNRTISLEPFTLKLGRRRVIFRWLRFWF